MPQRSKERNQQAEERIRNRMTRRAGHRLQAEQAVQPHKTDRTNMTNRKPKQEIPTVCTGHAQQTTHTLTQDRQNKHNTHRTPNQETPTGNTNMTDRKPQNAQDTQASRDRPSKRQPTSHCLLLTALTYSSRLLLLSSTHLLSLSHQTFFFKG